MQENRMKSILRVSVISIIVNIALGIFKAIVGFVTNSVAITLDAVNNLTDAGSSIITIVSTYFASKTADKKHPFGYGRTEYLGTLLIGGLILYAGITAFVESVKKIISPEIAEYSGTMLMILVVAVLVKIMLALYTIKTGKSVNSDSLIASGKEAFSDVAISVATILAALLYMYAGVSIEAWLGAVIAILIIKAGIETLKETIDKILGASVDVELVKNIKSTISKIDGVEGAYDLVLHNYGPEMYMGSVHIAVEDTMTIDEFDNLSRRVNDEIFNTFGVGLSAIGLYCVSTKKEETIAIRKRVQTLACEDSLVRSMHGFFVDTKTKKMRFDLVISFDSKDRKKTYAEAVSRISKEYPGYEILAGMDIDYNEI